MLTTPPQPSGSGYTPKVPKIHQLLSEAYKNAMTTKGQQSLTWCERTHGILKALEALKHDGALPPLFRENFREDLLNISREVNPGVDTDSLTNQQVCLSFGIDNLQALFK